MTGGGVKPIRKEGGKLEKCVFLQSRVKYLGHVISAEGVATDQSKVQVASPFQCYRAAFLPGICKLLSKFCRGIC